MYDFEEAYSAFLKSGIKADSLEFIITCIKCKQCGKAIASIGLVENKDKKTAVMLRQYNRFHTLNGLKSLKESQQTKCIKAALKTYRGLKNKSVIHCNIMFDMYFQTNQYSKAIQYANTSLKLNKYQPIIKWRLSLCKWEIGKCEEAWEICIAAKELNYNKLFEIESEFVENKLDCSLYNRQNKKIKGLEQKVELLTYTNTDFMPCNIKHDMIPHAPTFLSYKSSNNNNIVHSALTKEIKEDEVICNPNDLYEMKENKNEKIFKSNCLECNDIKACDVICSNSHKYCHKCILSHCNEQILAKKLPFCPSCSFPLIEPYLVYVLPDEMKLKYYQLKVNLNDLHESFNKKNTNNKNSSQKERRKSVIIERSTYCTTPKIESNSISKRRVSTSDKPDVSEGERHTNRKKTDKLCGMHVNVNVNVNRIEVTEERSSNTVSDGFMQRTQARFAQN